MNNLNTRRIFVKGSVCYTYEQAQIYVNVFIKYFKDNSITRILIAAKQDFYTYVLILASYVSDVTFCCYDPSWPLARQETIISDYDPQIIVTPSHERNLDKSLSNYGIITRNFWERKIDNNIIAYVIYTSGSTGTPKGVLVRRDSLETLLEYGIKKFGLSHDDVCSQYSDLWFDMSMFDVFACSSVGSTIVPFTKAMKLRPGNYIKEYGITFWNSVPQAFVLMQLQKKLTYESLHTLKKIKLGGDSVSYDLVNDIFNILRNASIYITYGPTECTIFSTCLELSINNYIHYFNQGTYPIGYEIDGVKITLDNLQDNIGEIIIKGSNVAEGYIGNDIGSAFKNGLLREYKTGDYAFKKNNCIYFSGRKDTQVKINGNRIDLTEIEGYLSRQYGIQSCCFLLDSNIILSYVDNCNSSRDIFELIKTGLPNYAFPNEFYAIDIFPVTSNGKLDRQAVKERYKHGKRKC